MKKSSSHPFLRLSTRIHPLGLMLAGMFLMGSLSAQAGTYVWNSAGTDFGTAANWTPSATFTSADLFQFSNSSYANAPTVSADLSIGGLHFTAANTGGITFGTGANTLTLSGVSGTGIQIDSGSGAVNTGSAKFNLAASQTWLNNAASTLTVGNSISNTGDVTPFTLTIDGPGSADLSGIISDGGTAGTIALTKSGTGTLTLSRANTYTGATKVNAGALKLDFSASGAPATDIINNAANSSALFLGGGTLELNGKASANNTQRFASTSVSSLASTMTLTQNSATTLSTSLGAISRTAGSTLNFSVIPLTSGIIATTANSAGLLGTWASVGLTTNTRYAEVNASGQIVAYNGGTAATSAAAMTDTTGTVNYDLSAVGTSPNNNMQASFSANTIRYAGGLATISLGATKFSVNGIMHARIDQNFTFAGNTLTIGANRDLNILSMTSYATRGVIISSVIQDWDGVEAGASSVTYNTTVGARLTLSSPTGNTFSGGLFVNGGEVHGVNFVATSFGTGTITIGSGTLLASAGVTVTNTIVIAPGGAGTAKITRLGGAGLTTLSGGITVNNNLELQPLNNYSRGLEISGNISTDAGYSGDITLTPVTLVNSSNRDSIITLSGTSINHAGSISNVGTGGIALTNVISGALGAKVTALNQDSTNISVRVSGANTTFKGAVNLRQGTLILGSATALGGNGSATGTGGTFTISGGTTLDSSVANLALTTVNAQVWNGSGFTFAGTQSLTMGTGGITFGTAGGTYTVTVTTNTLTQPGAIADNGAKALTKAGAGTLVLSGTNTYTGATTISAGTLRLGIATTNLTSVTIAANAVLDLGGTACPIINLDGSGTVSNGTLSVTGSLSPAGTNATGTLTVYAPTTLSGTLVADCTAAGNSDTVVVQGSLDLTSAMLEIVDKAALVRTNVYTLATCSGTRTGTFTATNLAGTSWDLRYTTDGKVQLYYKFGTMVRFM